MSDLKLVRSTIRMNRASGYTLLALAVVVIAAMWFGTVAVSWLWLGLPLAAVVSFSLADWLADIYQERLERRQ